jgi:IS4 transposase
MRATPAESFRELWDGAALFVPSDDDAAAARAVQGLFADPACRAALGRAARTRAAAYGRKLSMSESTRAQPAPAASSTARPKGS